MDNKERQKLILKAESWCLKNNILIYAEPIVGNRLVRVVVCYKGTLIRGQKVFKQSGQLKPKDERWWDVVTALRLDYYNKENQNK